MGRINRCRQRRGIYHIYNRSANQIWILDTDDLKLQFLTLTERFKAKYHLKIYHYCMMSNHFHFAIEGDIEDISSFISGLCSRYSVFYHKKNQSGHGPIWQGRYKSILVEKEHYLLRRARYIELNPERVGLIELEELRTYKWSSAHYYLSGLSDKLIKLNKQPYYISYDTYSEICQ